MSHGGRQLALRIFVCSTSVTATGCSITSTATVSTIEAIGCCFTFRAAFFAGAGLGLAVRFVAFADFATFRALSRLGEFALRSLARLCSLARLRIFDPFLRL